MEIWYAHLVAGEKKSSVEKTECVKINGTRCFRGCREGQSWVHMVYGIMGYRTSPQHTQKWGRDQMTPKPPRLSSIKGPVGLAASKALGSQVRERLWV